MIKEMSPAEAIAMADAVASYARTATAEGDLESDRLYNPTHLVAPRLDTRNTPHVHAHSLLSAMDRILRKSGVPVTQLESFKIRKPITRELMAVAGDEPQDRFPGVKPAVEVVVLFEDGTHRLVSAYDFGAEITNRTDPDPLFYFSLLRCEPLLVHAIRHKADLPQHPGIYLGACVQAAASVANHDAFPPQVGIARPSRTFVHSFENFEVPSPDSLFESRGVQISSQLQGVRALSAYPQGKLVTSRVDFTQENKRVGGGTVNMAYIPSHLVRR